MMTIDDKVGGGGGLSDDVIKKYTKIVCVLRKKVGILISLIQVTEFFFWKNEPELVCSM